MTSKFLKVMMKRGGSWLSVVALVVTMAGCLDTDNDGIQPVPVGYVSIYNAVPDAPGLDISVDDKRINAGTFDYSDYSGYLNFRTGDRNLKFTASNAANSLADTKLVVAAQRAYSVFLINSLANVETLVVEDSASVPASGKAMIRFIQLSPDAPELNVEFKKDTATPWVSDAAFKDISSFSEVSGGQYSFKVTNASTGETVLTADDVAITAGGYYTIITRGFTTPPSGNSNVLSLEIL